ncbi:MAG: GIY-YIG nuclease family protein [Azonexus sp.]|nr:GIY-YIG nuclease family protein [Azonexus sp.]
MPGLVKIGYTSQEEASSRIAQLYTTGVPVPFTIEFACRVENAVDVEKALHTAFSPSRINPKREFFRIEPEQAIAILRLLHTDETTQEVTLQASEVDHQSLVAAEQMRARRPNLNFEEMGIPVGSELRSVKADISVIVTSAKKVRLGDEEMSLTAATRQALALEYSVAPGPHWTFDGKLLGEIYEATYGDVE